MKLSKEQVIRLWDDPKVIQVLNDLLSQGYLQYDVTKQHGWDYGFTEKGRKQAQNEGVLPGFQVRHWALMRLGYQFYE